MSDIPKTPVIIVLPSELEDLYGDSDALAADYSEDYIVKASIHHIPDYDYNSHEAQLFLEENNAAKYIFV